MATTESKINDTVSNDFTNSSEGETQSAGNHSRANVGQTERIASAIGGGALALYGLTRGNLTGLVLALVGGSLIYRGVSGHCEIYHALGINTADDNPNVSVKSDEGIKVEKSVTINRSPAELYQFWRKFENLPQFMRHLEAVRVIDATRSHWVAAAPAGTTVEWDAEIINDKPNELIAWRSLEGSDVANAGSVHFEEQANGRGTVVKVALRYAPPAGRLGALVAKLFGEEPERQVEEDLRRFKQLMETGEIVTTEGQPAGRSAKAGK
jgi:uncharacterized membrane protein